MPWAWEREGTSVGWRVSADRRMGMTLYVGRWTAERSQSCDHMRVPCKGSFLRGEESDVDVAEMMIYCQVDDISAFPHYACRIVKAEGCRSYRHGIPLQLFRNPERPQRDPMSI